MNRVAWIDRPEVIARHCSCPRDSEGEIEVAYIHRTDQHGKQWVTQVPIYNPQCALHGEHAQPAPF